MIPANYSAAAASLVAVLSDDAPAINQQIDQDTNNPDSILDLVEKSNLKAKKLSDELREKAEPIKIRIKTKLSKSKFGLENFNDPDLNKKPVRTLRQQQKDQSSINDYQQQQTVNETVEPPVLCGLDNAYSATTDYQTYDDSKPVDAAQLGVQQDTATGFGDAVVSTETKQSPKRATRNKAQAKEIPQTIVEAQQEAKDTTTRYKRNRRNQKRTAEDNFQDLPETSSKEEPKEAIGIEETKQTEEPIRTAIVEKEPLMVSPKKRRVLERNIPNSPPLVAQTRTRRGKAATAIEPDTAAAQTSAPVDRKTRSKRIEEKMQVSKMFNQFTHH